MNNWLWSDALQDLLTHLGLPEWLAHGLTFGLGALILASIGPFLALVLLWLFRKALARVQDRIGPNRHGPFGLFQSVADALKLLTKETIAPANTDWVSYNLAPILAVFGVIMSLAVIAFAPGVIGVDLNIGVIYIVAVGSFGVFSALLAGWSSNNKYALLGGFRVVAQLLSYEIPMLLAMLMPVLLVGSMRMTALTEAQELSIFGLNLGLGWFAFIMPGAFLIFFIAALAESEQTPFDLIEAESELIAGVHIEYSGMKWSMFQMAHFLNTFFLGAVTVILFLGGWQGPFITNLPIPFAQILGFSYLFVKTFAIYLVVIWIQFTFPRLRVDQMMSFAWKVLVPAAVALLLWTMLALKLPGGVFVQYTTLFAGNIITVGIIINVLTNHFKKEEVRSKRAFEPKSLIGTMQPIFSENVTTKPGMGSG